MSQQAIGRILLMPKGDYSASTTYNMLDWCRYNGKAWVCKQDNTVGIAPSESAVWTMLVQDGSGGTGSGDMQKTVYDTDDDGVVDSAETISGLTASIAQLNYLNTATSNIQTQINGKVSDNPTFTQASTRTNVASGDSISTLFGKIMKWFSDLKDLAFIAKPTSSPNTKYLRGDGSWQTFPTVPDKLSDLTGDVTISSPTTDQVLKYNGSKWVNGTAPAGGHTMVDNTPLDDMIDEIANATTSNNKVVSAYGVQKWSNNEAKIILTTAAQDDTGVGTWLDSGWESGTRSGWLWSEDLYHVLEDGSGNRTYDVELVPVFDIGENETVSLYAWRIDDDVTQVIDGVTKNGGCIAFKFNGAVQSASGVKVGVKIVRQRTEVNDTGRIISQKGAQNVHSDWQHKV